MCLNLNDIGYFLYMQEQEEKKNNSDNNNDKSENNYNWKDTTYKEQEE